MAPARTRAHQCPVPGRNGSAASAVRAALDVAKHLLHQFPETRAERAARSDSMIADTRVLSEAFEERVAGGRLLSAVFFTFRFDPGFFEQEVLPVFVDVPSFAPAVRLIQLEEALRSIDLAVYYDRRGLVPESESAKLDYARVPITQPGYFHPKNVFALVQDPEEKGGGERLIVAALSANLTKPGWWTNV